MHLDLEDMHSQFNEQATKEALENYFQGWVRPERLKNLGSKSTKSKPCSAGTASPSSTQTRRTTTWSSFSERCLPSINNQRWKRQTATNQTYEAAKIFFEEEANGFNEVHWLMGDTTKGNRFDSAAAAIKDDLHNLLQKFNTTIKDRIRSAIEEGLQHAASKQTADTAVTESINTIN